VAVTEEKLGDGLAATGKVPEALKAYNQSSNLREQLVKSHPTDFDFQQQLVVSYEKAGDVYAAHNRQSDALSSYNSAMAVCNQMIKAIPDDPDALRSLAVAHESLGRLQINNGKPTEALANYEQDLAITKKLAEHNPTDMRAQHDLEVAYGMVGAMQGQNNQPYKALDNFKLAMPITLMLARNQSDARAQRDVAALHYNIASVELQIAEEKDLPVEERRRQGRSAIEAFHTSRELLLKMKAAGTLAGMDLQALDDADVLLRECNDTLAGLDRPTSGPTTTATTAPVS
jgi:tetratricopeptide (TPR) repeat protein